MTLTSQIAHDTPAARGFRRLAALVALLGLLALIVVPGLITRLGQNDRAAAAPSAVTQVPHSPER